MDASGQLYRVGSSFRQHSSSWRAADDSFSQSYREEDDEEALRFAALDKLPSSTRMRTGFLLSASKRKSIQVDPTKLNLLDRKLLLDRLAEASDGHEKLLSKIVERIRRVGLELPTIEVRFEHLKISTEAYVGSNALPSFYSFYFQLLENLLIRLHFLPSKKRHFSILKGVSGIIKPSRMTLLLGPPASGKTSLLLALAGKLDPQLQFSGHVTYNGHEMNEFIPQKTAAYISQHDVHIGELTVRETLSFSARCQGVGTRYDLLVELIRREKDANIKPEPDLDLFMKATATTDSEKNNMVIDYILKLLGLEFCADTPVGNDMIRGISGGQRKRVTTGEMLVGPAGVLFMDEISTGLDSSTTFQIVNSMKHTIHALGTTAVIALLQPAPETYDLFDDVILLSEGVIVYQGSRENVLQFFEHMGFKCPERKGVADFLQEVTSMKDQGQYWTRNDQPYQFVTVEQFASAFKQFHEGLKLENELKIPFDKSKNPQSALSLKKFGTRNMDLLKACFAREFLLMKRNLFFYIFKLCQLIIMGLISMTLFLRTEFKKESADDGAVYMGALFFTIIMIMFNGMAELPMTILKLPVFYKQRDLLFFPAWAYSLPLWILQIPIAIFEVGTWVFVTYYVVGFDPSVSRLFKQYLLLVVVNQMASSMFRLIAAAARNMIVANTFGSFFLLAMFVLGGFILSKDNIKDWLIWGYWISPLMYGQNAIVLNEFLGESWNHILPNSTEPLGIAVLKSRGFFTHAYWYWIGVGASLGFFMLFNLCSALALTSLKPYDKLHAVIMGEDEGGSNGDSSVISSDVNELDELPKKKGMILPFEQHSIVFDDVVYSVDMPPEMKNLEIGDERLVLLNRVSGCFRPGVLTALMGVSGAGKTTLMDVLAGRKTGGHIEGRIMISGYRKKQETFARISGYCEQNDIHSPNVTVYESLLYSAWLRLSTDIDSKTRKMFVEEVMELVELAPLRHALVGMPGVNGLSTEQRKRLTIAVELVANPSIIFMDEPTSGLDARAAATVMRTVRNTVDTGRTVVCTIHQPSIDIFEAFDELFLLKRGGQEIYVGPLGHNSASLIKYFEDIEGVPRIKNGYNPATWMLEVTTEARETISGVDFAETYNKSDLFRANKELINRIGQPAPDSKDLHFRSRYSRSFFTQCVACLWKQRWSYWRNTSYTAIRFIFTTFIALMFGALFWNLASRIKTGQDLSNAMGSMYAAVLFLGVQNASTVQPVVAVERTVFYRERAAGMYSALPYALAQVVVEIPYILCQGTVYGIIVYAMIGFEWDAAKFFWYLFFMNLTLLYFTLYGMMSVAMTPNQNIASILSAAFYGLWNLFSGFIIPRTSMPVWWRWYFWANPVSWTLYGLVSSQFGNAKERLDSGQAIDDYVKDYFGYRHDFLGAVAAVILGINVLFAFIFAFSIKSLNFQRR